MYQKVFESLKFLCHKCIMYLKNAPSKLQLQGRQINVNRRDTFYLKFILILQLRALDSPYFRMNTIFELTCLLFDQELIRIVHKFGVHPVGS